MFTYTGMHTHAHMFTLTGIHTCTHVHTYRHAHTHIHTYRHAHIFTRMHKHKRPRDRKSLASSGNNEMFKFVKNEVRINKNPDMTDP